MTTATATEKTAAAPKEGVPRVPVDPRVMQMVVAVLPSYGEAVPSADQQTVAEQVEQIMVDALQAQEGKRKAGPDEAEVKAATGRFFSGDVAGAEARKKQEEADKKAAEQQAAAQKAAGQAPAAAPAKA